MGHVAGRQRPFDQEPVAGPRRQHVDVEMADRLGGARSVRLDEVEAVGLDRRIDGLGQPDGGPRDGFHGPGCDLEDARVVRLGDYEAVPVMDRIDVHEGERVGVLEQLEARHRAGDDLAEDAIGNGFHGCSLREMGSPSPFYRRELWSARVGEPISLVKAGREVTGLCHFLSYRRRPVSMAGWIPAFAGKTEMEGWNERLFR